MDQQLALDKVKDYEQAVVDADKWETLYQERRDLILAYVKDELDALDVEMQPYLSASRSHAAKAAEAAKNAVLELGQTVRGESLLFVYNRGRTSWNSAKLSGMMALIPQLKEAQSVGEPTISIRSL